LIVLDNSMVLLMSITLYQINIDPEQWPV
jgi:hypothetical protein